MPTRITLSLNIIASPVSFRARLLTTKTRSSWMATAATRMTQDLFPPDMLGAFGPEAVVPAMLVLAAADAPTRTTLCAGAGAFEAAHVTLTHGAYVGTGPDAPERLQEILDAVRDRSGDTVPASGAEQGTNELRLARRRG